MDRERTFIGSFNFDPRSVIYNTELGLVIRSPTQCASMKVDILNGWSVKATRLLN
jgi:putative cardiolipin synthase